MGHSTISDREQTSPNGKSKHRFKSNLQNMISDFLGTKLIWLNTPVLWYFTDSNIGLSIYMKLGTPPRRPWWTVYLKKFPKTDYQILWFAKLIIKVCDPKDADEDDANTSLLSASPLLENNPIKSCPWRERVAG